MILGAPDTYLRGAEASRLLDAGFLVCENNAVSVAAALDSLPLDLSRIDQIGRAFPVCRTALFLLNNEQLIMNS